MGATITPFPPPGPTGYVNYDFQVIDNDYHMLSIEGNPYEHNLVLKSSDYGVSWSALYDTAGLFSNLSIIDSTFGLMAGTYGAFATTQGSDTVWVLDTLFGQWYVITTASQAFADSTILLLSFDGASFITTDRGQTWNWGYCANTMYQEIQYFTQDTIYAVGYSGVSASKSAFSYSVNGGANFSTVMLGYNSTTNQYDYYSRVYDMYFETQQHGYLVGYTANNGTIFETSDSGRTWTAYLTGFNNELHALLNVNDSIAFIGGTNGLLLKWNKNVPLTNILSTEQLQETASINLFPNPFSKTTTITLHGIKLPATITIYDQLGRTVRTETITTPTHTLQQKNLPPGTYHITVGKHNGKFIISQ